MPDSRDGVGTAIERRIAELSLTLAEIQRRSGVSAETITKYMRGTRPVRKDKQRALAEALGWGPDFVERIDAGLEPAPVDRDGPGYADEEVRRLAAELAATRAEMARMFSLLEDLARRLPSPDAH